MQVPSRRARAHRRSDDAGVSDILGSIMLVGITVAVFTALSFLVFAGLKPVATVHADVVASISNDKVVLTHQGGQTLTAAQTTLTLRVGGASCTFKGSTGANAIFTAAQFGGVDHQSRFKVGDVLNVTPVAPCPALAGQSVSTTLVVSSGTGTSQALVSTVLATGGTSCGTDNDAPVVASWALSPADVTNVTLGNVSVTAGLVDVCSDANDDVAPHFAYCIGASTCTPLDVGPMFRVGSHVWQGNVTDPGWASQIGKTLRYQVLGLTDMATPPNVGNSDIRNENIQGTIVSYSYPSTCTMVVGTVVGPASNGAGGCPTTTLTGCPALTAAATNVLYGSASGSPNDCNEQANFTEGQAVAPSRVLGASAKEVTGSFQGNCGSATDTYTFAFGAPDLQYACYANGGAADKLKVSGFAAPPVTVGSPGKVELAFVGHVNVDSGGTSSTNDKVKVFYNIGATAQPSIPASQTFQAFNGTTCTPAPCSTLDIVKYIDVTSARSWLCADIGNTGTVLSVEADGATSNAKNHVLVDSLGLRVTGCGLPSATTVSSTAATKVAGSFLGSWCPTTDSGPLAIGDPNGFYACYAGANDKLNVYGFAPPVGGAITKVELRVLAHVSLDPGALAGSDSVTLKFNTGSTAGAGGTAGTISGLYSFNLGTCVVTGGAAGLCTGTPTLPAINICAATATAGCSGADESIAVDVTAGWPGAPSHTWSWSDFTGIFVEADAATASGHHLQVDAIYLRVTAVNSQIIVNNVYATSVVTADKTVTSSYHAELQPDNLYAEYTSHVAKETVGGFAPLSGTISKVELGYEGQCRGSATTPCDVTKDKLTLSYKVGSYNGPTKSTFFQAASDAQTFLDVTTDGGAGAGHLGHAWTWTDISRLTIQAQASTHSDSVHTFVDAVWVRVTASGAGYTLDAQMSGFTALTPPAAPSNPVQNILEVRYQALANDTFAVQLCQDASATCGTWLQRGTLTAGSNYFLLSIPLTPAEFNSGNPRVRLVDANPLGPTPGKLAVEYLRVGSS